ncbi:MAG: peptidylprolyl isomerase [Melioribacteraceae bacterium]
MKKIIILLIILSLTACSKKMDTVEQTKTKVKTKIEKKLTKLEVKVKELMELKANEFLVAKVKTSMGDIEIELFADKTPKTVENFVGLATKKYYDGIIFHRIIADFMVQGGDPTGTGRGGESFFGSPFEDEFDSELTHSGAGILSMANAGPGTNGSQFFITLVPTPWLDGKHSIFGSVISGLDVVTSIGAVKTTPPNDKPEVDIVMEEVTIEKRSRE